MRKKISAGWAAAMAVVACNVQADADTKYSLSTRAADSPMLEFRVVGDCPKAHPLRAVTLHLPPSVRLKRAVPRAGWDLAAVQDAVEKNGPLGRLAFVRWIRTDIENAGSDEVRFTLEGRLPESLTNMQVNVHRQCKDGEPVSSKVMLQTLLAQ